MEVRCHVLDRGFPNSGKQFVPMFPLARNDGKGQFRDPTAPFGQVTQQGLASGMHQRRKHYIS